ncbi:MAG: flagellar basal body-associated FliL family protein [Nitriliruptoraceae bacterium]
MGVWLRTTGALATAGALLAGAWWSTDRDAPVLRIGGSEALAEDEDIVTLDETTARLADGRHARIRVAVVTAQPEAFRAQEAVAASAVLALLAGLEHEDLLGAERLAVLRAALHDRIDDAVPDAEVERVLVTGLLVD